MFVFCSKVANSNNWSSDLPFYRAINPYRGCGHGCINVMRTCLMRFWDFLKCCISKRVCLYAKGRRRCWKKNSVTQNKTCKKLSVGQIKTLISPLKKIRNYKGLPKGIHEIKHPVDIVTLGSLVERKIDLFSYLAGDGLTRVGISVTPLNASLARKI